MWEYQVCWQDSDMKKSIKNGVFGDVSARSWMNTIKNDDTIMIVFLKM